MIFGTPPPTPPPYIPPVSDVKFRPSWNVWSSTTAATLKAPPKDQIGRTQSYAPTFSKHLSNAPSGQSTNAEFHRAFGLVHTKSMKPNPAIGHLKTGGMLDRTYTSTTSDTFQRPVYVPTQSYAPKRNPVVINAPLGESTYRAEFRKAFQAPHTKSARQQQTPPKYERSAKYDYSTTNFDFKNFDTQALAMARGQNYAPKREYLPSKAPLGESTNRLELGKSRGDPRGEAYIVPKTYY